MYDIEYVYAYPINQRNQWHCDELNERRIANHHNAIMAISISNAMLPMLRRNR